MGVHSCKFDHAWYCYVAGWANDQITTGTRLLGEQRKRRFVRLVLAFVLTCIWAPILSAEAIDIRIATYAAPLSRDGPGLLLRDISGGEDTQIQAVIRVIDHVSPDILLLTDFDFDAGAVAISAFSQALEAPYPYLFVRRPNAGFQTDLDLDGDGFAGDARDAIGYGRFLGDGGMAVLSRYPIDQRDVIDLSQYLWADIPNATLPQSNGAPFPSVDVFDSLPVSSTAHWIVPIDVNGVSISMLAFDATPPVFDGPEDFNGLRNRDELLLWELVLDGVVADFPKNPVLIGNANIDPFDGEGVQDAITRILEHPALQDPKPRRSGGQLSGDANHIGPAALDTVDWPDDGPGNLRVSYVLPSSELKVTDAGVFWPAPDDPNADLFGSDNAAGAHRLVWVDLMVQSQP